MRADLTAVSISTGSSLLVEIDRRVKPKAVAAASLDNFSRTVYCVLGVPIDVADSAVVSRQIEIAAARATPFLLSTVNLNFLVASRSDAEFRDSLLLSDLCTADGMPIVWIARLLGIPIKERIAGADLFDALKSRQNAARRLKVFLFGGGEGVAAAAGAKLNSEPNKLTCVGSYYPGFGTIDEMSTNVILDTMNASGADVLIAALGAKKGQAWLLQNHDRLQIPVRAHLGAVINLQAGNIKRAPARLQKWGFEWLWRIKEEPYLWRRYAHDGYALLRLMITRVLPLAGLNRWYRIKSERNPKELLIATEQFNSFVAVKLSGDANQRNIGKAIACLQETLTKEKTDVLIDLTRVRVIDGRFLGLLLMVRKFLKGHGKKLDFVGVSPMMRLLFRINELDFLFNSARAEA